MKHSVIVIPLSEPEEDLLRLIAHGKCPANDLNSAELDQLRSLGLVQERDGQVELADFGKIRLAQIKELQFRAMISAARERQPNGRAA